MKGFVGVTDNDWFPFFSEQQKTDEANLSVNRDNPIISCQEKNKTLKK